jgi:hypothetical protein
MRKVFKVFPYWKGDEEEAWLGEMHQQGWILTKRFLRFQFTYAGPEKMLYKRDYQPGLEKHEREEYIKLYEESGWEYITRRADMYYFRISEYEKEEITELYTDLESKIEEVKKQFRQVAIAYWGVCMGTITAFSSAFDHFPLFRVLIGFAHIAGIIGLWKLWTKRKSLENEVL